MRNFTALMMLAALSAGAQTRPEARIKIDRGIFNAEGSWELRLLPGRF
jgi:hypothetical protein